MTNTLDQFLDDDAYDEEPIIHPPMVVDRSELGEPHHDSLIENAKADYEFVRTNLKQIIETNVKGLEGLAKVAQESESPRAYEVLSTFMKQMVDANESLIGLHKQVKDITNETGERNPQSDEGNGVTNNYFTGSTEELLDLIETMEKNGTPLEVEAEIVDEKV